MEESIFINAHRCIPCLDKTFLNISLRMNGFESELIKKLDACLNELDIYFVFKAQTTN